MNTPFPYPDSLENEASYLAAQKVWQDLIGQVARVHGHQPLDYLNLEQNGTPLRDGNPIAAISVAGKGIRIIQVGLEEEGNDFSAWFNTFGEGDPATEREELVIDLKLTHGTLSISDILIELWVSGRLDEAGLAEWVLPWGLEEE